MLHENEVVKLRHRIPRESLTAWLCVPSKDLAVGDIGTVVMVYTNDSIQYEYEVEFVDEDGMTRGLQTLKADDIEPVRELQR